MPSAVHDERYQALISELRRGRIAAGMNQTEMAARLNRRQQFVSKYEAGERRLDAVEFFDIVSALDLDPVQVWQKIRDGQAT